MLPEQVSEKIEFELEEIGLLFELYKNELSNLKQKPNLMEITAYAGILHSFYNGVEKIFLVIAKNIDGKIPDDSRWHKTLLVQMTVENEFRPAVLSQEMKKQLLDYLAFRHFFRHSYSFRLEWEELEELVTSFFDVWEKFKAEILALVKKHKIDVLIPVGIGPFTLVSQEKEKLEKYSIVPVVDYDVFQQAHNKETVNQICLRR